MSATLTPRGQGRSRGRGGLGKYLRARGRRGGGRPAEFSKRLRLEDEGSDEDDEDDGEHDNDKYAKRQIVTNIDRYEEPQVDPHVDEEPEPEVDLSSFLERQRLNDKELDPTLVQEEEFDDGIDHSLSNLPSASSSTSNTRKNKLQTIQWDASMDQLKQEKEAAEAVWDLKSRFRNNQPRLGSSIPKPSSQRDSQSKASKTEDSRHVYKPPDAGTNFQGSDKNSTSKAEMEGFLDDLLS